MSFELPPMAQGSPEAQLSALRDYLVRLAHSLDGVCGTDAIGEAADSAALRAQREAAAEVKAAAHSLKALIVKTADEVEAYADAKVEEYDSLYVARSEFGSYYEQIQTQVEQTARAAVESYHYTDAIEALETYMTELSGQIRRGVIEDPVTHELHLGIAVSERLSFETDAESVVEQGVAYRVLSPGQTLGLYTASGWQFWINGYRRGWFSSEDSMLHVANIVVENQLQLGADWQITTSGGFGLRYIGG